MSRREDLRDLLETFGVTIDSKLWHQQSLLQSGRLDSLALFNLAVWVEKQIGRGIDFTSVNIREEWDTADAILAFIDSQRSKR